jgi:hypothetical protein
MTAPIDHTYPNTIPHFRTGAEAIGPRDFATVAVSEENPDAYLTSTHIFSWHHPESIHRVCCDVLQVMK